MVCFDYIQVVTRHCSIMYSVLFLTYHLFICIQVGVRAGIYHGGEALCDITNTRPESGSNPSWNQYLDFDLNMVDIPRMARLCLVIYGVCGTTRKTKKRIKEVIQYKIFNYTSVESIKIIL